MHDFRIVKASHDHLEIIADNMRGADVEEIWAASHSKPLQSLTRAFKTATKAWTGLVDGQPAFMFGVSPVSILGGEGTPWMLGTDDVLKVRREFLRKSRLYVYEMHKGFDILFNYIDERNTVSKRWLKWIGFEILDPEAYGPDGMLFHRFEMKGFENV